EMLLPFPLDVICRRHELGHEGIRPPRADLRRVLAPGHQITARITVLVPDERVERPGPPAKLERREREIDPVAVKSGKLGIEVDAARSADAEPLLVERLDLVGKRTA